MKKTWLKNGFIIKAIGNKGVPLDLKNYFGIGAHETWPLDERTDSVSETLNRESMERWFGFRGNRLWAVPDMVYLKRYADHCQELGLNIFCLQVESLNNFSTTFESVAIEQDLGFDYADVDMQTSCFYEDLVTKIEFIQKAFAPIKKQLNQFGLMPSQEVAEQYLAVRRNLIRGGYDMEEYFAPTVVKLSKAVDFWR